MTKAELVEEVARAAELNKRDAEVIVETVFDSIIGALHKGEKVELRGFGSFRTRERGPRRGRNPKTGEPVDVPAKRVPYFKPGKELKEFFTDSPDGEDGDDAVESQGAEGHGAGNGAPASAPAPAASEPAPATSAPSSETSETTVAPANTHSSETSEKPADTPGSETPGGSSHSGSAE